MTQVKANGITIEVADDGPRNAPAIIIINGFVSQLTSWAPEFHEGFIKGGFRTIRFDNRDTGLSTKFDGVFPDLMKVMMALGQKTKPDVPYTFDDMADDAAGVLDALGIESAHVLGASMGGSIAQMVAVRHPKKCRSLISLMSTTSDPSLPSADPKVQEALMARPAVESKEEVIENMLRLTKAMGTPEFPEDDVWHRKHLAMNYDRSYYPEGSVRQWMALLASPPRTEALKALRGVPTLVVHGDADNFDRPEAAIHTHECVQGSELVWIKNWSHDLARTVMPLLHEAIIPFMKKVERERAEHA